MRTKQTLDQKFEVVQESYINGQRAQATEQFKRLSKTDRKQLIKKSLNNYVSFPEAVAFDLEFLHFLIERI